MLKGLNFTGAGEGIQTIDPRLENLNNAM